MAALLTRMSSRPKAASACSAARTASFASATSAAKLAMRAPGTRCAIAFTVAASASALASTSTAIPPSAQMSSPVAAPMPAPPPVISATLPATRFMGAPSLGRNGADLLGGGCDARTLQLDRGMEFGGPAEVGKLPGVAEPRRNRGIGADLLDVHRDALAQRQRHFGRTKKSHQPVEREVGIAGLGDRRYVGQHRRPNAVGHGEQLDLAGLQLWPHDRVRSFIELNPPGGEVVGRLDLIAIGHLRHVEAGLAQEPCHEEIDGAGGPGPVE